MFSSTIAAKVWFATAAVILAVIRVLTASRLWGNSSGWCRSHCVFILGYRIPDARVAVHAAAGTVVYGVLAAKLLMIRRTGFPHWAIPVAGGTLACLLLVLWVTSSLWYFTNVRFGF